MAVNDIPSTKEVKKWAIDLIENELSNYVSQNCHSSDGDGDWVEFEESDAYCCLLIDLIDFIRKWDL